MGSHKVPVQSLIDHIKTACDVDPWAKEMAEELLKEHQQIVRCKDCKHYKHMCDIPALFSDMWCSKLHEFAPFDGEGYCAFGERKNDDG